LSACARLVATSVFPVPPFPLATETIIGYARVIFAPQFGQLIPLQGTPTWCGTFFPQEGQTHMPPGPAPA